MSFSRHAASACAVAGLVACTSTPRPPEPDLNRPASALPTAAETSDATASTSAPSAAASMAVIPPASERTPPRHEGPLALFHDALRDLEAGRRSDHVRIAWLGDSHAQADFWTDTLRRGLQKRFGLGGPGFVHFGFRAYRHGGVRVEVKGKWRFRPRQPSTSEPWGDGAFGLGGILHAGYAEYRHAIIEVTDDRLDAATKLTWDLCYKFGSDKDQFKLEFAQDAPETFAVDDDIGQLQHLTRESTGPAQLKAKIGDGRPDFCGLVIETDRSTPGVVVDTLGINGARYGTALAWNEEQWANEVKRRTPELFVLEYGGNEASDRVINPALYKKQLLELIARVRRIRGDVSCLVIGAADRADAEAKIPPIVAVQREAASEAQCMFWDTYTIMGGKGSLRSWRAEHKAAADGVHLKPNGYKELGALLLADLMKSYRKK